VDCPRPKSQGYRNCDRNGYINIQARGFDRPVVALTEALPAPGGSVSPDRVCHQRRCCYWTTPTCALGVGSVVAVGVHARSLPLVVSVRF
jgi:hypothetical protein